MNCHFYKEFFDDYQNETVEIEDRVQSLYIVNSVFNAFSAYSAIMLNILSIHAMRKTSSLPKPLKTLLLSLAASDLGIGLLVQPLYITLLLAENSQNCVMPTVSFIIIWFFANASFLGILAISVDRFLAIHLHLRYQELVTHKRVVAAVIFIWLLSAFLSWLDFWMARAQNVTFKAFVTIFFGLCFICTTVVYCRIYVTARRHRNEIQAMQLQAAASTAQNGKQGPNVTKQRKSSLGTFYVYLVFLVCHLPEYCIFVASLKAISDPNTVLKSLIPCAWTLVFLNSSLNPLVYCWKMRQIRHTILDTLRNVFLKVTNEKSID